MKNFSRTLAAALLILLGYMLAVYHPLPQLPSTVSAQVVSQDPCMNQNIAKQPPVAVSISSATTTQIISVSGNSSFYVCQMTFISSAAAAHTFQLEYGTGANCAGGTTNISGAMTSGTTTPVVLASGDSAGSLFQVPAGNGLCIVSTGTPGLNGFVTYIKQGA